MKKMSLICLTIVVFLIAGVYSNHIKLPIERKVDYSYVVDFENDRVLMGASHNVFVIKVLGNLDENIDENFFPSTLYEADVIYNIKGECNGKVVVNQQAGYKHGILVISRGDSLMEIGETYLVATRVSDDHNWYTINTHPNGKVLISDDAELDNCSLKKLARENSRVNELEEAYKTEILLDVDVKTNRTFNSYQNKND